MMWLLGICIVGGLASLWYGSGLTSKDLVWFTVGWSILLTPWVAVAALVWWLAT